MHSNAEYTSDVKADGFGPSFELAMQDMVIEELEGMEAPSWGTASVGGVSSAVVSYTISVGVT